MLSVFGPVILPVPAVCSRGPRNFGYPNPGIHNLSLLSIRGPKNLSQATKRKLLSQRRQMEKYLLFPLAPALIPATTLPLRWIISPRNRTRPIVPQVHHQLKLSKKTPPILPLPLPPKIAPRSTNGKLPSEPRPLPHRRAHG